VNELRTMHLFAGIGGGLLCDLILGHRPVVAVEWEPYACQVLRERAAEGWFPGLHVWEGDVRLFDPSEYAGKVDCIHAGFPCQDISVAGKQAGVSEGTRSGLYREVLRIAGIVRPKYLFLENVAAILSNGLGTVLADLAAMGYDSRWCCLRASDVGAPHLRDRWWLLADADSDKWGSGCMGKDAESNRRNDAWRMGEVVSNAECVRLSGQWKSIESFGSAPDSHWQTDWTNNCGQANIGWWDAESELGRLAYGIPNRVGQLKGYGNAQVPMQAAVAWKLLGGQ